MKKKKKEKKHVMEDLSFLYDPFSSSVYRSWDHLVQCIIIAYSFLKELLIR